MRIILVATLTIIETYCVLVCLEWARELPIALEIVMDLVILLGFIVVFDIIAAGIRMIFAKLDDWLSNPTKQNE